MAVDTHLAVSDLANRAGVLACYPDRRPSLLEKASVIKDQNRIAVGRQFQHLCDSLTIERIGIPLHCGQQTLQVLFTRARNDGREGIAVLMRVVGQQPAQIPLKCGAVFSAPKQILERVQEVHQLGQRRARRPWQASGCAHAR